MEATRSAAWLISLSNSGWMLQLNQYFTSSKERAMEWTTPNFEEIDLGCEINSYANAEL